MESDPEFQGPQPTVAWKGNSTQETRAALLTLTFGSPRPHAESLKRPSLSSIHELSQIHDTETACRGQQVTGTSPCRGTCRTRRQGDLGLPQTRTQPPRCPSTGQEETVSTESSSVTVKPKMETWLSSGQRRDSPRGRARSQERRGRLQHKAGPVTGARGCALPPNSVRCRRHTRTRRHRQATGKPDRARRSAQGPSGSGQRAPGKPVSARLRGDGSWARTTWKSAT